MFYRRRTIFSSYGVVETDTTCYIKVIATDIDKQVLDKARMGLYNEKSIANVPKDLKDKYFKKIGHPIRSQMRLNAGWNSKNTIC